MFMGAYTFNQDISKWDVSAVTTMRHMFHSGRDFNQPIGSWDISSVDDTAYMFHGATFFAQGLCWNLTGVSDQESMFTDTDAYLSDTCSPSPAPTLSVSPTTGTPTGAPS